MQKHAVFNKVWQKCKKQSEADCFQQGCQHMPDARFASVTVEFPYDQPKSWYHFLQAYHAATLFLSLCSLRNLENHAICGGRQHF